MNNQAFFSLKDNNEKIKCRLLQFLFGALRVNMNPLESVLLFQHQAWHGELPPFSFDLVCFCYEQTENG